MKLKKNVKITLIIVITIVCFIINVRRKEVVYNFAINGYNNYFGREYVGDEKYHYAKSGEDEYVLLFIFENKKGDVRVYAYEHSDEYPMEPTRKFMEDYADVVK